MTKKDYEIIGDALVLAFRFATDNNVTKPNALQAVQEAMVDSLARENVKFDSVRFREYIAAKLYS